MNAITKQERAGEMMGVNGRFFSVVSADNGRILNQTFKARREYTEGRNKYAITAEVRFDDNCNNRHESFSITADIRENGREYMGGCCHDEIAQHFPEFAPLIKWHLTSTDGPMHYIANTMYHALEHGATHAWVYYEGEHALDPLGLSDKKGERLCGYLKSAQALKAEGVPGYRIQWDNKTVKTANFDYARSAAIWPDATIEQLRDKAALEARLPQLLADFKAAMIGAGFVWPEHTEKLAA